MTDTQKALDLIICRHNNSPLTLQEFEVLKQVKAALEAKAVHDKYNPNIHTIVEKEYLNKIIQTILKIQDLSNFALGSSAQIGAGWVMDIERVKEIVAAELFLKALKEIDPQMKWMTKFETSAELQKIWRKTSDFVDSTIK